MTGNVRGGVRAASDFLMALQLTGAAKPDSLANMQLRLPVVVIGGGLTAIDTATEALARHMAGELNPDAFFLIEAGALGRNRTGILLGNEATPLTLTITHVLWSLLNVLPEAFEHHDDPGRLFMVLLGGLIFF